jgi:hypothetical protein
VVYSFVIFASSFIFPLAPFISSPHSLSFLVVTQNNTMAEQTAQMVSPQAAFATPDRDNKADLAPPATLTKTELPASSEKPTTVTPVDAVPGGKHVRFGNDEKEKEEGCSSSSTETKRGLVSRRGGRLGGSAGTPRPADGHAAVLEFKTFRSPQRKRDAMENDTVPSLCSAGSGISSVEPAEKGSGHEVAEDSPGADQKVAASGEKTEESRRPSSISCDASIDTSPLTSNDANASPSGTVTRSKGNAQKSDQAENEGGRRIVTFSPPTPQSEMVRIDTVRFILLCPFA